MSGQKVSSWAYQLAAESSQISCDTVDLAGFPFMDQKYHVIEMPKVIVNDAYHFGGQMNASTFLQHILTAAREFAGDNTGK